MHSAIFTSNTLKEISWTRLLLELLVLEGIFRNSGMQNCCTRNKPAHPSRSVTTNTNKYLPNRGLLVAVRIASETKWELPSCNSIPLQVIAQGNKRSHKHHTCHKSHKSVCTYFNAKQRCVLKRKCIWCKFKHPITHQTWQMQHARKLWQAWFNWMGWS